MSTNSTNIPSLTEFGDGVPYPEGLRISLIILGFVLFFLGVPGNMFVIGTILKVKTLRVRLNMFIINLAIADTIIVGYLVPVTIADHILGRYPGTAKWCFPNVIINHTVILVEIMSITLIAISRYTKLCQANVFNKVFNKTGTLILCVAPWLISITYLRDNSQVTYNRFAHACMSISNNLSFSKWFRILVLLISYTATSLCYWKIRRRLQVSHRNIRTHGNEFFSSLRYNVDRNQAFSNLVIFIVFIFLQTPLVVVHSWFPNAPASLQGICLFLFAANSSVNCIIYGIMNKNIRRTYIQIIPTLRFIQVRPTNINP